MISFDVLDKKFQNHEHAPKDWSDRYAVYLYANTFAEEFIKQKDTAVLWSDSSVVNMVLKKRWINKDYYTEMVAGERWLLLRDVVYYILSLQEEN